MSTYKNIIGIAPEHAEDVFEICSQSSFDDLEDYLAAGGEPPYEPEPFYLDSDVENNVTEDNSVQVEQTKQAELENSTDCEPF
ncbi:MAG: hypothetical protein AAFQ57_12330 [Cyanobacteria bacterium J06626_14]